MLKYADFVALEDVDRCQVDADTEKGRDPKEEEAEQPADALRVRDVRHGRDGGQGSGQGLKSVEQGPEALFPCPWRAGLPHMLPPELVHHRVGLPIFPHTLQGAHEVVPRAVLQFELTVSELNLKPEALV